jgi:dGTPase
MPSSLEGMCVRIADRIAYINHDIEDTASAGVLNPDDLPQDALDVVGRTHSKRIATMVMNVLESSVGRPEVKMTGEVLQATNALKDYMYANVYTLDSRGKLEMQKGQFMLKEIFRLYMGQPNLFSEDGEFKIGEYADLPLPERARAVTDFVAGMTDRYLSMKFKQHFMTSAYAP